MEYRSSKSILNQNLDSIKKWNSAEESEERTADCLFEKYALHCYFCGSNYRFDPEYSK